ncbi:MAG: hypothetical protein AAGE59_30635 [Cyanobacteria bacterium P01_F01_bin.86]
MPRSAQPNLVEIKINVPGNMLQDSLAMFEAIGLKPADAHRDAWMAGVFKMAEDYAKLLKTDKLRREMAEEKFSDEEEQE